MSKSLTVVNSPSENNDNIREFNEFDRIEGLKPTMLRWLREKFQVFTVNDLAKLSLNQVLYQLEDEGKEVVRRDVEHWIDQAREFSAEETSWQTFATFVLSLQARRVGGQIEQRTIAYFLEGDKRKIWSGIECNGVYSLILDQLKRVFHLQPTVTEPTVTAAIESETAIQPSPAAEILSEQTAFPQLDVSTEATQPILKSITQLASGAIEITRFRVLQPPEMDQAMTTNTAQQPFPISLKKDRPFEFEVTFQFAGTIAVDLTKDILKYGVGVYVRHLATGETRLLRSMLNNLEPRKLIYTCHLRAILSTSSLYRLWIVTRMFKGRVHPGLFELPVLQIV